MKCRKCNIKLTKKTSVSIGLQSGKPIYNCTNCGNTFFFEDYVTKTQRRVISEFISSK